MVSVLVEDAIAIDGLPCLDLRISCQANTTPLNMNNAIDIFINVIFFLVGMFVQSVLPERWKFRTRRKESKRADRHDREALTEGLLLLASCRFPGCIEIQNNNSDTVVNLRVKVTINEWAELKDQIFASYSTSKDYPFFYTGTGMPENNGTEAQLGLLPLDTQASPKFVDHVDFDNHESILVPVVSTVSMEYADPKVSSGEYALEFAGPNGVSLIEGENEFSGKGMACLIRKEDVDLSGFVTVLSNNASIITQEFTISFSPASRQLNLELSGEPRSS